MSRRSPRRRARHPTDRVSPIERAAEAAASELLPLLGGADADADDHLYRSAGRGRRDLPSYTHDRQIELAYAAYLTDPLARRIVELTKDFVVGGGLRFEILPERGAVRSGEPEPGRLPDAPDMYQYELESGVITLNEWRARKGLPADPRFGTATLPEHRAVHPEYAPVAARVAESPRVDVAEGLTAVLAAHWRDPDNLWDLRQHDRALSLGLWGELILPVFVRPTDGHVKIGALDPRAVAEVRADPNNADRLSEVVMREGLSAPGRAYRLVAVDEDPASATHGYLVGEAFYFAVNRVQGARRGHSDLFHLLDWLDAYRRLLMDAIDAAKFKGSFVWDVSVKNATPARLAACQKEYARPPRPGTVRIHDDSITWSAVTPSLEASQHAEFARLYRTHILGGAGLPEHWFGEGDSANRATAAEMGTPVFMRLRARRAYFAHVVEQILRFQVDQAILAGRLKGDAATKNRVHVVAPDTTRDDIGPAASALVQSTQALAVAEDRGWIGADAARRAFAAVAASIGAEIDPDAERAAAEAQARAAGDAERGPAEAAALRAALGQAVADRGEIEPRAPAGAPAPAP